MRFLWSGAGVGIAPEFAGVLTTPAHRVIPPAIVAGAKWAADNQNFTMGFRPHVFFPWLDKMQPYRAQCLFVPPPDKVGDALSTLALFEEWRGYFTGWSLAFVAQDGQELLDFPPAQEWQALFIGGSTAWKESVAAIECIKRAQALGKHIHIGRVNWKRRYQLFAQIQGSEEFTCDGTRQRFEGAERTSAAWREYQNTTQVLKLW